MQNRIAWRQGLKVRGVPTSEATRRLADAEGIPLLTFDDVTSLDLAIDGADEADARLALIKGGGGALLREKVVARAAKRFVVIADSTKLVPTLGAFPLPVEVIPFASRVVADEIRRLGGEPFLRRTKDGATYVTDNGNWILDCRFGPITHPGRLASALDGVPGIAEHGLFVNMAALLIVGLPGGATRTLTPQDG